MDRRQLLFGMTALAMGGSGLNDLLNAQSTETANFSSGTSKAGMSDRERSGLRGPVRTCVEEGSITTEYDPDGRMVRRRWPANAGGGSESVETWTYDTSGRLRRATSRNRDGSPAEKVYVYDDEGRLLSIIEGNGDRTDFQYNEQGRKTEIRSLAQKPDERQGAVAMGMDLVFADIDGSLRFDFPGGASTIKTIYNERDQPTEVQAYGADGRLLNRLVRTYDATGRITDVRTIIEDPTSMFPAEARAQMLAESGLPPDEVRAELKKVLSAFIGDSGKSYTYDSQGRIKEAIVREGVLQGKVNRTYTYNDNGEIAEERTTFSKDPSSLPLGVSFHPDEYGHLVPDKPPSEWPPQPDLPKPSAVHYEYQYDRYGNWTERTIARGEEFTSTTHRELTYY